MGQECILIVGDLVCIRRYFTVNQADIQYNIVWIISIIETAPKDKTAP